MTKKDYVFIAKIIKDNTSTNDDKMLPTINKINLINALCIMFSKDNKRFNKGIFIDAC